MRQLQAADDKNVVRQGRSVRPLPDDLMGLGEDGTEDWDLFVDNLDMFFTGSDIRKFAESVARLIQKFTEAGLKLNRKKCKIGFVRMQVLGFLCEKGQCSVDQTNWSVSRR